MRNQKVFDLVILSMFLTIFILMAAIPNFGFITVPFIPGPGVTIMHIPVLVATFYFGVKIGGITGFFFGMSSLLVAIIRPIGPVDYVFQNPIVSVLPRVIFPILTAMVYKGLSVVIKNSYLTITLSAIMGTIIHTLLVLPLLTLFGTQAIAKVMGSSGIGPVMTFLKAIIITYSSFETLFAALIVPPIVIALRAINPKDDEKEILLNKIND